MFSEVLVGLVDMQTFKEIAATRSATERDHENSHANNAVITEAVSTSNINGQKGLDLNEIDYVDGSFEAESSFHAGKTFPHLDTNFDTPPV